MNKLTVAKGIHNRFSIVLDLTSMTVTEMGLGGGKDAEEGHSSRI